MIYHAMVLWVWTILLPYVNVHFLSVEGDAWERTEIVIRLCLKSSLLMEIRHTIWFQMRTTMPQYVSTTTHEEKFTDWLLKQAPVSTRSLNSHHDYSLLYCTLVWTLLETWRNPQASNVWRCVQCFWLLIEYTFNITLCRLEQHTFKKWSSTLKMSIVV